MKKNCKFCNLNIKHRKRNTLFCNDKCRNNFYYDKKKGQDYVQMRKYFNQIKEEVCHCEYCDTFFELNSLKTLDHIIPY
ncbi:unnamed protein product, partial [marine sediment metagenome]